LRCAKPALSKVRALGFWSLTARISAIIVIFQYMYELLPPLI
jgi:hypothetical protein